MSMTVNKIIRGQRVSARAVYRGGVRPACWTGIVNERTLPRQFKAPADVFRFVKWTRR